MRFQRLVPLLMLLCLFPILSFADGSVINLIASPEKEYTFAEGVSILEVVFPRVHSSDCAILRFEDEVMMIDASTPGAGMQARIKSALEAMGITRIDTAFNTHPHNDHIGGFETVYAHTTIDQLVLTFPEDYNKHMIKSVNFMKEHHVPISHVSDGDVFTMGDAGAVRFEVIQRNGPRWTENDQSAMLMVSYGDRSMLLAADIENRAQTSYAEELPACGIQADILKYPHHDLVRMNTAFFEAVSPELTLINGGLDTGREGRNYLKQKKADFLVGYKGLTRMRTDGIIWVIDYLDEIVTDD